VLPVVTGNNLQRANVNFIKQSLYSCMKENIMSASEVDAISKNKIGRYINQCMSTNISVIFLTISFVIPAY